MPLETTCPRCKHVLRVPAGVAGRWLTCPRCLSSVGNPNELVADPSGRPAPPSAEELRQTVCPECGRELRLSVGLAEPFLQAWILLAIAILVPAGIGLVFVVILLRDREFMPNQWWYIASAAYFMACIPLAAVALILRPRFIRLAKRTQWAAAAPIALVSALMLIWFLAKVR